MHLQAGWLVEYIMRHSKENQGLPTATWGGFSAAAAFSKWGEYLQYGIPAMLMLSLEWWTYEVAVLENGWLPNAQEALRCEFIHLWSSLHRPPFISTMTPFLTPAVWVASW